MIIVHANIIKYIFLFEKTLIKYLTSDDAMYGLKNIFSGNLLDVVALVIAKKPSS